jgi:hypothetical protein
LEQPQSAADDKTPQPDTRDAEPQAPASQKPVGQVSDARITLTPDMRAPTRELNPVELTRTREDAASARPPARRGGRWAIALGLSGLILGLGALALSAWTYGEGQKEILRLSTELAQLRVSLDLYARNGADSAALTAMDERLAALEQGALGNGVPMPGSTTAAAAPAASADPAASEDCLPVGMRLLVASGDSYPICGQPVDVTVSAVADGYITLSDGTSVASGGTTPLPGNPACTIAVTSGGDEGLTGYAEIRVNC